MQISVLRLDPDLELPRPARPGDAGLDLRSAVDVTIPCGGGRAMVPTGFAVAVPDGHAGLVLPRSGLAARHGVTCANSPGLIDPGYRGEIVVPLLNTDPDHPFEVRRGDRIAQLVIQPVVVPELVEVESLGESERGARGHGSTGVG